MQQSLKEVKFQKANTNSSFQVARAGRTITTKFAHLKNNAGYVVRYTFQYTLNDRPKVETGTLSLGFSKKFTLPREGKDFTLKVQPVGRRNFVIDTKLSIDDYHCFSTKGTIFNPSYTTPGARAIFSEGIQCAW